MELIFSSFSSVRFQIGCYAYENLARVLGVDDEKRFAVGAEFALTQLRQIGGRGKVIHDVYHEPCVEEIEKLPSVFLGLRKRVNELLEEWPEHPSLNKVINYGFLLKILLNEVKLILVCDFRSLS